eukprot:snap_masked-scaffold_5-processed-gene-4.27-mRNA-1 protein AED:1.00 eAED:1.00 QI:0/-1/0/0/-1/1/1/0/520
MTVWFETDCLDAEAINMNLDEDIKAKNDQIFILNKELSQLTIKIDGLVNVVRVEKEKGLRKQKQIVELEGVIQNLKSKFSASLKDLYENAEVKKNLENVTINEARLSRRLEEFKMAKDRSDSIFDKLKQNNENLNAENKRLKLIIANLQGENEVVNEVFSQVKELRTLKDILSEKETFIKLLKREKERSEQAWKLKCDGLVLECRHLSKELEKCTGEQQLRFLDANLICTQRSSKAIKVLRWILVWSQEINKKLLELSNLVSTLRRDRWECKQALGSLKANISAAFKKYKLQYTSVGEELLRRILSQRQSMAEKDLCNVNLLGIVNKQTQKLVTLRKRAPCARSDNSVPFPSEKAHEAKNIEKQTLSEALSPQSGLQDLKFVSILKLTEQCIRTYSRLSSGVLSLSYRNALSRSELPMFLDELSFSLQRYAPTGSITIELGENKIRDRDLCCFIDVINSFQGGCLSLHLARNLVTINGLRLFAKDVRKNLTSKVSSINMDGTLTLSVSMINETSVLLMLS